MAISSFEKPYVLTDEAVEVLIAMIDEESIKSPLDAFESKMVTIDQLRALNSVIASSK